MWQGRVIAGHEEIIQAIKQRDLERASILLENTCVFEGAALEEASTSTHDFGKGKSKAKANGSCQRQKGGFMKVFLDGVLKVNRFMQSIAGISLTFLMFLPRLMY